MESNTNKSSDKYQLNLKHSSWATQTLPSNKKVRTAHFQQKKQSCQYICLSVFYDFLNISLDLQASPTCPFVLAVSSNEQ